MLPKNLILALFLLLVLIVASIAVVEYYQTSRQTKTVSSSDEAGLYDVSFQQVGIPACPFFGEPWAVTIGNVTKVQPVGTKLPINEFGLAGTLDKNITLITFLLPKGNYTYQIHPHADTPNAFFTPSSGILKVNGTNNIIVQIAYTGHGCITTANSSQT